MPETALSITAEASFSRASETTILLKVASRSFEANISILEADVPKLNRVMDTTWADGCLTIGQSANSDVWWSCDDSVVTVLVGSDDQSWDIGFSFPAVHMTEILSEVYNARKANTR